jgi:hypothetical protein
MPGSGAPVLLFMRDIIQLMPGLIIQFQHQVQAGIGHYPLYRIFGRKILEIDEANDKSAERLSRDMRFEDHDPV